MLDTRSITIFQVTVLKRNKGRKRRKMSTIIETGRRKTGHELWEMFTSEEMGVGHCMTETQS